MDSTSSLIAIKNEPRCKELFFGFLMLGMIGFGGVLPLARRMIVERKGWLTSEQFTELLGLCQFLPGGNICNLSVAVGAEFQGIRGAVAALTGLLFVPTWVVILLSTIYMHFQNNQNVQHLFWGLMAAATGLLIHTALKMLIPFKRNIKALFSITLTIVSVVLWHFSLLLTLLTLVGLNLWLQRGDNR